MVEAARDGVVGAGPGLADHESHGGLSDLRLEGGDNLDYSFQAVQRADAGEVCLAVRREERSEDAVRSAGGATVSARTAWRWRERLLVATAVVFHGFLVVRCPFF